MHHVPILTAACSALLASLVSITVAAAQGPTQPTQDELKQKRAEKLGKPVFHRAAWQFDYDQARALAKQEGKLLLVYFTRTYAH